ncbi:HBS1 protein [Phytophthora nicotianae]|uniref:HBS1 protein n=1 Tax=Phytophthora nicotianae TaxID=4792 RepID=A0A0W8DDV3_PHYNI|nr:HBS1 protein [Phytophthora nicotianae]
MDVIPCRGAKICSPFVAGDGCIHYVSAGTGEVFKYQAPDSHTPVVFSGGNIYATVRKITARYD